MRIRDFVERMKEQNWHLNGDSQERAINLTKSQYDHDGEEKLVFVKEQKTISVRLLEINGFSADGFVVWLRTKSKSI